MTCHCGQHQIGNACPSHLHVELKRDHARVEAECKFIGIQHDEGFDDLECWNCHCGSTLAVRVERRAA